VTKDVLFYVNIDLIKNFIEKLIDKVTEIDPINNISDAEVIFEFERKQALFVRFDLDECFAKFLPSLKEAYDDVFINDKLNELRVKLYGM